MAFDFSEHIGDTSAVAHVDDQFMPELEEIILQNVKNLNKGYKEYLKKNTNQYYRESSYDSGEIFEYKKHPLHPDYKAIHFYTRNIKNSGIGAWNTLGFWVDHAKDLLSTLYLDGAAFCTYDFFIETLGFNNDTHYYGFGLNKTGDRLKYNFDYIMKYMNIITTFDSTDKGTIHEPDAWACFRMNRLIPADNTLDDYIKFIKFCSTYEDNPLFKVKFNLSFVMNIVFNIAMLNNYSIHDIDFLGDSFKKIMTDREDIFLTCKDISNILLDSDILTYNKSSKESNNILSDDYIINSSYKR